MSRKAIPKSVRFEVFKRDAFKCQYCGASAPDVVLHIDHIKPVSAGGGNDPLNLVTSCSECNLGKGARKLSDTSAIEKQRAQMGEIAERKAQLEAMLNWRAELAVYDEHEMDLLAGALDDLTPGYSVSPSSRSNLKKWVKKYGAETVVEAAHAAAEQYLEFRQDGDVTREGVDKFYAMLPRVAWHKKNGNQDSEIYYIRGILRNRLSYVNDHIAVDLMRQARDAGVDMESLKSFSTRVSSWTKFRAELEAFING